MDEGKGKAKEKATKLPRSVISKGKKKLESEAIFDCPFCNQTASVTCTVSVVDRVDREAKVLCEKCNESYWSNILYKDPMPQPIDIYKEWTAELKWIKDYEKPEDVFSTD